jgi:phosphoadenosine phosphosulfate reductase
VSLETRIDEATRRLAEGIARHAPATFASSFGAEDMVLLDLIDRLDLEVEVFTLDTGRLHEETLDLIARCGERYRRPIRIMVPDAAELETFVGRFGVNAFYRDISLRKQCCEIRKMQPLRRALAGKGVWITGLRREQSVTRAAVAILEYDAANGLMKLNPLADWRDDDVWAYLKRFDVPVNALHARGFPSIGCAPCTRAVQPGEDPRAGRWWWEQAETRECGLHVAPDGRLVRGTATALNSISQRSS